MKLAPDVPVLYMHRSVIILPNGYLDIGAYHVTTYTALCLALS